MDEFVPADLPINPVVIIPPAIDPLSPKNLPLAPGTARQVLEWIGIRHDIPLISQVSRFDPWKDPLGVIAAYRLARERVPRLQLALAGSMALDDPEGWRRRRRGWNRIRPMRLDRRPAQPAGSSRRLLGGSGVVIIIIIVILVATAILAASRRPDQGETESHERCFPKCVHVSLSARHRLLL